MDTALEKIGVYDLLGTFLSGAIICNLFYFLISVFLSEQVVYILTGEENVQFLFDAFQSLIFSFFVGMILEISASRMERKHWKFRKNAIKNVITGKSIIKNNVAYNDYTNMINQILKNHILEQSDEAQGEYVYQYCKIYLEANKLNHKEQSVNALYALTRNVMMGLYVCIGLCVIIILLNNVFASQKFISMETFSILLLLFFFYWLIVIFKERCERFSYYRVQIILREYYYHAIESKK